MMILRAHLERLRDETLRATFLDTLIAQTAQDDPPLSRDYRRLNVCRARSGTTLARCNVGPTAAS
jgi:hypothetical protein